MHQQVVAAGAELVRESVWRARSRPLNVGCFRCSGSQSGYGENAGVAGLRVEMWTVSLTIDLFIPSSKADSLVIQPYTDKKHTIARDIGRAI
eukprot:6197007-Pleurochrysis_carterae.AAC.5